MRCHWVWRSAVASVCLCTACAATKDQVQQVEPYIEPARPTESGTVGPFSAQTEYVFRLIPADELVAEQRLAARRFSRERVLFLRLQDEDRRPVAFANVICLGTRLGTMTYDKGVAWLHGMEADSVAIKIMSTFRGSGVHSVRVPEGEVVGLEVRLPRARPVHAD